MTAGASFSRVKSKPCCESHVPREPDPEAVNQYLHFHTALFERTFFRHIRVLRAGEYLRVHRYGCHLRRYWRLESISKGRRGATPSRWRNLQHELKAVVGDQLMSDVPVGSFFSGGIDSVRHCRSRFRGRQEAVVLRGALSGQGVTDERPFRRRRLRRSDLDLQLITMDGSTFPADFRRLMYHQDEPVIGPAMFPMAKVSELAARQVKVCLGGQAADEIFGGYARYSLARPLHVLRSLFDRPAEPGAVGRVSSTDRRLCGREPLPRQFAEGGTLYRLAKNARHLANWETSYFEHFAKVSEYSWEAYLQRSGVLFPRALPANLS